MGAGDSKPPLEGEGDRSTERRIAAAFAAADDALADSTEAEGAFEGQEGVEAALARASMCIRKWWSKFAPATSGAFTRE